MYGMPGFPFSGETPPESPSVTRSTGFVFGAPGGLGPGLGPGPGPLPFDGTTFFPLAENRGFDLDPYRYVLDTPMSSPTGSFRGGGGYPPIAPFPGPQPSPPKVTIATDFVPPGSPDGTQYGDAPASFDEDRVVAKAHPDGYVELNLRFGVRVDIGIDGALRIVNLAQDTGISLSADGTAVALTHPVGRVLQVRMNNDVPRRMDHRSICSSIRSTTTPASRCSATTIRR